MPGTITGTGRVVIVDHTTDNTLVTFRFQNAGVKMSAAEKEFEAGGHRFRAGRVRHRRRQPRGTRAVDQGARPVGVGGGRRRRTCRCTTSTCRESATSTPGRSTQDEGWVRLAFDNFKVPYTYFGAPKLREGNLRAKYDVIIFPHAGQGGSGLITGGVQGSEPRPYKKTEATPNVGIDRLDRRHARLHRRRRVDGALQVRASRAACSSPKGATSTVFPEYNLTPGVTIETPDNLYVRGSVLKTVLGDKASPVLYGYDQNTMAVYFNQAPVMRVGGGGGFGGGRGGAGSNVPPVGNMQPNATPPTLDDARGASAGACGWRRRSWRPWPRRFWRRRSRGRRAAS